MATTSKEVLVIDDEPAVRDVLKRILQQSGYIVTCAVDGREALELVHAGGAPDLIILDLNMPVMSGFEVLSAMRVNPKWEKIPVIVMSGTKGFSAGHLGVIACIEKPFDIEDVRATVGAALV